MNYLVIDLEMCKVPKDYRNKNYKYASEIIQIGAVLLDERYRRRDEICLYVHPEHGVIDNFIANMTGIKNRQIKNAPKLRERLLELTEWIESIRCLHGATVIFHSCHMRSDLRNCRMKKSKALWPRKDGSIIRKFLERNTVLKKQSVFRRL